MNFYKTYQDIYIVIHESQGEQLLFPCNGRLILNVHFFWPRILHFIKNYLLSWQQLTFLSLSADQETERRNHLFTLTTLTSKILNVSFFQLVQHGAKWYLKSFIVSYCFVSCNYVHHMEIENRGQNIGS